MSLHADFEVFEDYLVEVAVTSSRNQAFTTLKLSKNIANTCQQKSYDEILKFHFENSCLDNQGIYKKYTNLTC
jgi:hypothetical protein